MCVCVPDTPLSLSLSFTTDTPGVCLKEHRLGCSSGSGGKTIKQSSNPTPTIFFLTLVAC